MASYADREHFIPLRKGELIDLLIQGKSLEPAQREPFSQFCKLLSSMFHFEYHSRLEELKNTYAPFDPDADTITLQPLNPDERKHRQDILFADFISLLEKANYTHLSHATLHEAIEIGASDWGLNMDVDFDVFDRLEVFSRGDILGTRTRRRAVKLWQVEEVKVPVYKRLVLILKLRKHKRVPRDVDTNTVFIKLFKDIPKVDLEMLLPGARLKMPTIQRGKLGVSMASSVGFVMYKLIKDAALLAQGLHNPVAFWTPLSLVFGYGYKQYYGFQQARVNYNLMLTQSLYYQSLDSNSGVLTRMVDEAEDQEFREALLGWYCLWRYAGPEGWTQAALDDYIELELERRARLKVDFEIDDALGKLLRLGVVEQVGERYRAQPLERALSILDGVWDNYFRYANPEEPRHAVA